MGILGRSAIVTKPNESVRLIVTTFIGVVFGFLIRASFPTLPLAKLLLIGSHQRGAVVAVVYSLVLVLVKRCYYCCIVAASGKLLMYGLVLLNCLFFNYSFSSRVLGPPLHKCNMHLQAMNWGSCVDWLSGQFSGHSLATSAKKLMLTCTIYCIWQKRSARFFSSVCTPANVVVRKVESQGSTIADLSVSITRVENYQLPPEAPPLTPVRN